ncbi:hypothetical protein [Hansschlegelia sp.]|uniref:hypothetical protein n=1 Tax=Hansschlegelia sp. TaxID=2041892 RepID=UPI002CEB3FB3|nr:hypothetical protein [Hansschlegelia sp.]HVI27487.1 hypothetical protein [Hansschlegelia sp.]
MRSLAFKAGLRLVIVTVLPVAIAWAVAVRLLREGRNAVRLAYWDACSEIEAARRAWQAESFGDLG